MGHVHHTSAFSDFSLPQLRELLSDGPDAKLIMILSRVLIFYILILGTDTEDTREHECTCVTFEQNSTI